MTERERLINKINNVLDMDGSFQTLADRYESVLIKVLDYLEEEERVQK